MEPSCRSLKPRWETATPMSEVKCCNLTKITTSRKPHTIPTLSL